MARLKTWRAVAGGGLGFGIEEGGSMNEPTQWRRRFGDVGVAVLRQTFSGRLPPAADMATSRAAPLHRLWRDEGWRRQSYRWHVEEDMTITMFCVRVGLHSNV